MSNRKKDKASELRVKSKTENLSQIRDFVSEKALEAGLPVSAVEKIMLAVDEACTNIIKHAYKSSPEGEIILNVNYDDEKFTITIIDYGKSFNPETIPLPDLQKYYREHKVGGLGISRFVMGESCLNCHTKVHGTNHPAGAKLMR